MLFESRRAEHEAKFKLFYEHWNLCVSGIPLHELIKKANNGDETAQDQLKVFESKDKTTEEIVSEVRMNIMQGSYFPGNHVDFDKLPEGLACTMCPAFYGVVNPDSENFEVRCEWPDGVQRVSMQLNSSKPGGAVKKRGTCRTTFGISIT